MIRSCRASRDATDCDSTCYTRASSDGRRPSRLGGSLSAHGSTDAHTCDARPREMHRGRPESGAHVRHVVFARQPNTEPTLIPVNAPTT